ncbi:MAG: hypothetical protein PVF30_10615, partial [Desulfobacterales bacterium]
KMTIIVNVFALKCQSAGSALAWCSVSEIVYKTGARCSVMSFSERRYKFQSAGAPNDMVNYFGNPTRGHQSGK